MIKIKLNPNKELVEKIKQSIKDNDGYCVCLIEQNKDSICPCKDMRENNICHCGLYINE